MIPQHVESIPEAAPRSYDRGTGDHVVNVLEDQPHEIILVVLETSRDELGDLVDEDAKHTTQVAKNDAGETGEGGASWEQPDVKEGPPATPV